jgi:hypothetical protein
MRVYRVNLPGSSPLRDELWCGDVERETSAYARWLRASFWAHEERPFCLGVESVGEELGRGRCRGWDVNGKPCLTRLTVEIDRMTGRKVFLDAQTREIHDSRRCHSRKRAMLSGAWQEATGEDPFDR